jgi:hypothetical protein
MANEEKKGIIKMAVKVIIGLLLLATGVRLVWLWRWDVLTVIRGFLGIVVSFAGIIFLAIVKE